MRKPSSSGTKTPCCSKVGIKKGPWTPEEDEVLSNYVKREGEGRWRTLPKRAGLLRCGKSCRLRWMNYLRPSVKRGRIAPDEEDLILRLHRLLGNRWSLIAGRIPGRTDNEIKNYWNTHLSKKLISQGIDPRTHKPLNLSLPASEINEHDDHHNHHHLAPTSKPNPNPPSLVMQETGGSQEATNMTTNSYQNQEDFINSDLSMDGFMTWLLPSSHIHGHNNQHEDYIGNFNEDTFSSFLDSLIINDNVLVNQQHQLPPPPPPNMVASSTHRDVVSSAQTNCNHHGNSNWDAEIVSTMAPVVNHREQQGAAEAAYNLSAYKTKYNTY